MRIAARIAPAVIVLAGILLTPVASDAAGPHPDPAADDFIYYTRPGDTLIGLGRRLLIDPGRWRGLQGRNAILQPRRMPTGTALHVPRAWLRQEVEPVTVISVAGSASSDGNPVKPGDVLAQGAQLATRNNGFLTLKLADGSLITLDPDGTLTLERLVRYATGSRDTLLHLQSGRVETRVQPQGKSGRFQIRTPVAVSAVRGTEFRRGVDAAGIDRTEVTGGTVAVSGVSRNLTVEVPENFGTLSDADGPHPPARLLPPPDLGAAHSMDDRQAMIDFPPVNGASSYIGQVASDERFEHIVAEAQSPKPPVNFGALAEGNYWVRVRSTDAQGLSGPDAAVPAQRHRQLDAPAPMVPDGPDVHTGSRMKLAWEPVESAAAYRVQWANGVDPGSVTDVHESRVQERSVEIPLDPGRYGWRVAAVDAGGRSGKWSTTQFITQKPEAPQIRRVLANRRQLRIEWTEQPGREFRVQVAQDAAFERRIVDQLVTGSSVDLPSPGTGNFQVRVQRIDADQYHSAWSDQRSFTIPPPWWVFAAPFLLALPFL